MDFHGDKYFYRKGNLSGKRSKVIVIIRGCFEGKIRNPRGRRKSAKQFRLIRVATLDRGILKNPPIHLPCCSRESGVLEFHRVEPERDEKGKWGINIRGFIFCKTICQVQSEERFKGRISIM